MRPAIIEEEPVWYLSYVLVPVAALALGLALCIVGAAELCHYAAYLFRKARHFLSGESVH